MADYRTAAHAGDMGRRSDTLRHFLSNVLFTMCVGLAITGVVAYTISINDGAMSSLFGLTRYIDQSGKEQYGLTVSMWFWIAAGLELLMVIFLSMMGLASRLSTGWALTFFIVFAMANGITLAPVLYAYTTASTVRVFFITSAMFGGCALWGHTTKTDLTGLTTFFIAALMGLLAALVVNIFYHSPAIDYTISGAAVLLFSALTAYDMQKLEKIYDEEGGTYTPGTVVYGALSLYLDFLNLFLHLLRLFGVRK
jgi:uncharacterized protein